MVNSKSWSRSTYVVLRNYLLVVDVFKSSEVEMLNYKQRHQFVGMTYIEAKQSHTSESWILIHR